MDTKILKNKFFQSMHSPKGANAFFACGFEGGGGFGNGTGDIPNNDIFIGMKNSAGIKCLPFFALPNDDWLKAYREGKSDWDPEFVTPFDKDKISRIFGGGIDKFEAENLTFEIATSPSGIPDPETAPYSDVKYHTAPLVPARITIDNTKGDEIVEGIFVTGGFSGAVLLDDITGGEMCGITGVDGYGFAVKKEEGTQSVLGSNLHSIYAKDPHINFHLASCGGVIFKVNKGEKKTVDIIIGFYRNWNGTTGAINCDYYYKKFFTGLTEVFDYGFVNAKRYWSDAKCEEERLENSGLNEYRQFITAQATRAYNSSSMLLADSGRPRYVVYEGTYMMMNTFDLTVDHLFYEMRHTPWAVKNQLDSFADEYSYYDMLHLHGESENKYPGGVTFCHDQGVFGHFMPKGHSSYEVSENHGCFSYMSQEQLCNFILCAGVYVKTTGDMEWLCKRRALIEDCLISMQNRDHFDPEKRDGMMDLESSGCGSEDEITTYDSLDASLGQSRRNIYIAGKCFASYLLLEMMFNMLKKTELAKEAKNQAKKCAASIASGYDEKLGYIPAILDGKCDIAIIPAVEGLVYPYICKITGAKEEYKELYTVLEKHLKTIIKKGICLFDDNGWKLSSGNINSFMSKILISQFVAENVFQMNFDEPTEVYDAAHSNWWADGCRDCPALDQIFGGKPGNVTNFHYPRAVTCDLWLWGK